MGQVGKKRSAASLELRARGSGAGRFVIMDGGRQVMSTGLGPDREEQARAVLAAYRAEAERLPERGSSVLAVRIEDVLDWAGARVAALPPTDWRTRLGGRNRLATLRRHWTGKTVADVTNTSKVGRGTVEAYVAARTKERSEGRGGPARLISEGGAVGEVNLLRTMIREYAAVHSLQDVPRFRSGGQYKRRLGNALTRDQVAALLWTCLGFSRDATTGRWRRSSRNWRGRRTKRAHVARFVLLSVYTGSTERCLRRLRWRPAGGAMVSHVDVEGGLLHRLGDDAAAGRMAGVPVRLPRRLLSHLARWRRIDEAAAGAPARRPRRPISPRVARRRGVDGVAAGPGPTILHVLHPPGEVRATSALSAAFTRLRAEAGLADGVTARDLSYTTGVWILKAGTGRTLPPSRRRESVPATFRTAAFLCGMTYPAFKRMYATHKPKHMEDQHRALECPVESVR